MLYTIKFRLDIKKNVYVSKKAVSAEPYYQISALIKINKGATIHYYTGYSAQKNAWFGSAVEAYKADGNRSYGIHRNAYAKKKTSIVLFSEVNKKLDRIASRLAMLAEERDDISRDELIDILDVEIGKKTKEQVEEDNPIECKSGENPLWVLAELFYMDATVSPGRNKTRMNAMHHFKNFEVSRKRPITFEKCNMRLLSDFMCYLIQDEGQMNDNARSKSHCARKKNRNTISKILSNIKFFFTWCRKRYGVTIEGNVGDFQVPTAKYGDPVTLTQEEKRKMFESDMGGDAHLEYIRDMFYFQCSIGARVSDFFKLKNENLIFDDGKWCIRYMPSKTKDATGIACRIPLSSRALGIVEKYRVADAHPKMPLFDFPKHSQTYNDNLKKVFQKAGLDRTVVAYNAYDEAEFKPLYELAMSKFARSSFIDTLVGQGVTDNIIRTMSGHAAGSKAFHRYHNTMKNKQQNEAVALLD
jgi:integrase